MQLTYHNIAHPLDFRSHHFHHQHSTPTFIPLHPIMSLASYPPEIRHSDDDSESNKTYLHWPDLHLSSFDDVECPTLDPTLLGHSYSRAMEVHARRLLWGHILLTPSIFKAPPDFRKQSHFPAMGEVGLLCMGTFKPLWGTFHPDGTDWIPLSRYNLPMLNVEIVPPREFLPSEMPAGARSRSPPEIEARLPGRGKHGKDLYARLELGQSENPGPLVFKQRSLHTAMFVCASYEKWQEVAPRVREDYGLKHLAGPMEYVMFTGGFSVERWKTLVSDEMQSDAEYDSEKTPAQNGLKKRIVSVGEMDKNVERAWVSIRFYKCLSRKVYQERGKLDQVCLNPAFARSMIVDKLYHM